MTLTHQYRVSVKKVRRAIHFEIEWRNANDDRYSCATFTNVVAAFEFVAELSMSGNKTRITTGSYLNHTGFLWMWYGFFFNSFSCCCCLWRQNVLIFASNRDECVQCSSRVKLLFKIELLRSSVGLSTYMHRCVSLNSCEEIKSTE